MSADARAGAQLERGAIGLTEVLFQSITHMAPGVAVALSIGFATAAAGASTTLGVILALGAALLTAYSIGELAKHLPSAGGMYTYVGRGLGSFAGWLLAWAFLLAEPIVPPVLFAAFGFYAAGLVTTITGFENTLLWLPFTLACAGVVWWLTYRGIQISTRTGVILGAIEIGVFVIVSLLLIVSAGGRNTVSVFLPGAEGLKPALHGMVFCLLAFVGFEAAAPLAEETRDPKRNIRRAVLLSCVLIGIYYTFCYYAATVFLGPDQMSGFLQLYDGSPWNGMADAVLPAGGLLITFAILNSCLANANAGATASTRAIFALGRSSLLPRMLAAIHPQNRTPVNAVHLQAIIGIVLAVGLSLWLEAGYAESTNTPGPLNTYFFLGYALGLLFAGMYMAVNLASIGFYLTEKRDEFNVVKHLIIPIAGFVLLIPAFFTAVGGVTIPIIDLELTPLGPPYNLVPLAVLIWMIVGIVLGLVLWSSRRETLSRVGEAVAES